MKLDPVLTKAVHLARRRKFNDAINTLEPEVNRYYGSFTYYYLLGLCYLYSKIFGMALSYLKLAYEQKMRDPSALLGLAVLYLNHGDTDKAIDLYLEVQTIDGSNRIAKRALKILKKHPGPDNISIWIDSGSLHTLFPPFPKAAMLKKTIIIRILAGIAVLSITFVVGLRSGLVMLPGNKTEQRIVPIDINLAAEERETPVQTGGSYRYVLTRNQVLDEYNEALKLFTDFRDDGARVRLNRILESNASEPIKNRSRLLISYMTAPGFDTLIDRFSFSDVIKDPFVYRDCHIIWRGMATNLISEQNHTSFDFLVGYDTRRIVEGIVQVDYDFAIPLNTEFPLEILGRIIPIASESIISIKIQGLALNQTGLLEQM